MARRGKGEGPETPLHTLLLLESLITDPSNIATAVYCIKPMNKLVRNVLGHSQRGWGKGPREPSQYSTTAAVSIT